MYSPQIEELINAILADGVITEKERNVLHKRAMAEGIDPDEIDVIVDGRLFEMNKAKTRKHREMSRLLHPKLLYKGRRQNTVCCINVLIVVAL